MLRRKQTVRQISEEEDAKLRKSVRRFAFKPKPRKLETAKLFAKAIKLRKQREIEEAENVFHGHPVNESMSPSRKDTQNVEDDVGKIAALESELKKLKNERAGLVHQLKEILKEEEALRTTMKPSKETSDDKKKMNHHHFMSAKTYTSHPTPSDAAPSGLPSPIPFTDEQMDDSKTPSESERQKEQAATREGAESYKTGGNFVRIDQEILKTSQTATAQNEMKPEHSERSGEELVIVSRQSVTKEESGAVAMSSTKESRRRTFSSEPGGSFQQGRRETSGKSMKVEVKTEVSKTSSQLSETKSPPAHPTEVSSRVVKTHNMEMNMATSPERRAPAPATVRRAEPLVSASQPRVIDSPGIRSPSLSAAASPISMPMSLPMSLGGVPPEQSPTLSSPTTGPGTVVYGSQLPPGASVPRSFSSAPFHRDSPLQPPLYRTPYGAQRPGGPAFPQGGMGQRGPMGGPPINPPPSIGHHPPHPSGAQSFVRQGPVNMGVPQNGPPPMAMGPGPGAGPSQQGGPGGGFAPMFPYGEMPRGGNFGRGMQPVGMVPGPGGPVGPGGPGGGPAQGNWRGPPNPHFQDANQGFGFGGWNQGVNMRGPPPGSVPMNRQHPGNQIGPGGSGVHRY